MTKQFLIAAVLALGTLTRAEACERPEVTKVLRDGKPALEISCWWPNGCFEAMNVRPCQSREPGKVFCSVGATLRQSMFCTMAFKKLTGFYDFDYRKHPFTSITVNGREAKIHRLD